MMKALSDTQASTLSNRITVLYNIDSLDHFNRMKLLSQRRVERYPDGCVEDVHPVSTDAERYRR